MIANGPRSLSPAGSPSTIIWYLPQIRQKYWEKSSWWRKCSWSPLWQRWLWNCVRNWTCWNCSFWGYKRILRLVGCHRVLRTVWISFQGTRASRRLWPLCWHRWARSLRTPCPNSNINRPSWCPTRSRGSPHHRSRRSLKLRNQPSTQRPSANHWHRTTSSKWCSPKTWPQLLLLYRLSQDNHRPRSHL